jgi:superfamily II RNA helicase
MPPGAIAQAAEHTRDALTAGFLLRGAVLQQLGYLDNRAHLTESGRWAMQLSHPRLLILAELVRREQLPKTGPRLAAYAAALGTERPPRGGGGKARLASLSHVVDEVVRVEREMGLVPDSVAEEFKVEWHRGRRKLLPSPAGRRADAVEAWAAGTDWAKLVAAAESEEGDLQRSILQAAEILMQIENLPQPALRALARATREILLRAPVV